MIPRKHILLITVPSVTLLSKLCNIGDGDGFLKCRNNVIVEMWNWSGCSRKRRKIRDLDFSPCGGRND